MTHCATVCKVRSGESTSFTGTFRWPAIHGWLGISFSQSLKLGMNPRSSITCCSATSRTCTTLPTELVMVRPKMSSMT